MTEPTDPDGEAAAAAARGRGEAAPLDAPPTDSPRAGGAAPVARTAGAVRDAAGAAKARAREWARVAGPRVRRTLVSASRDPGGWLGTGIVFALCLVVAAALWTPLSLPPTWINMLVARVAPASCAAVASWALVENACIAGLGLLLWAGSLVVLGVAFLVRRPVMRWWERSVERAPEWAAFLAPPLAATALFTMAWSGNAFHWWAREGIVRDAYFPVIAGLAVHVSTHHGPGLERRFADWFDRRDEWNVWARLGATVIGLYLLSLALRTRFTSAETDQLMVLGGLVAGYFLMAPRSGAAASHAVPVTEPAPVARSQEVVRP